MSEDGGVMSSQETDHVSPTEVTPELGKGALDTWRPSRSVSAAGFDKTGTHATDGSLGEAVGKPGVAREYTNQRLNHSELWEGSRRTCQGLKPDPGNLAVRHFRGASRTLRHGETVNPPAIERAGPETPHLQRGALDLYPNRRHHSKPDTRHRPTRPTHVHVRVRRQMGSPAEQGSWPVAGPPSARERWQRRARTEEESRGPRKRNK